MTQASVIFLSRIFCRRKVNALSWLPWQGEIKERIQDKAIEGLVMFALNRGEVCTCPSRAFIQEDIYDRFMERVCNALVLSSRAIRWRCPR
jgi:hypothetical protein